MGKAPVRKLAFQHPKFLIIAALAGLVIGLTANGLNYDKQIRKTATNRPDSIASVAAFGKVYKVLKSPRCMNCHPAGNIPLQGDDSHLHTMSPIRGKDGKGVYAMKCANCHQATNSPGVGTPPGNPNWALPPEDMKMVFQGKSARELALQIMDYKRNGHKNKAQLIAHARDTLVKAGWNMGDGRKPPPIAYKEFVAAWDEWINKGGYAPGK
ncbi:c-type cytochrome [Chitinophaga sp. sic0106]|nr:c-type cytochrome [Chitinophaga sp. sic0106]MBV7532446.1 c-type cytochrome [Chitinophaga sp. sic0106]